MLLNNHKNIRREIILLDNGVIHVSATDKLNCMCIIIIQGVPVLKIHLYIFGFIVKS